jgi:phenylacetate-coenzyme A ligase PaaK-like adenylate-forming protein
MSTPSPREFEAARIPYNDLGSCVAAAWDVWVGGQLTDAIVTQRAAERLQQLVAYAREHSPFYRTLYRALPPRGPVRLGMLPIVTKQELMTEFDTWPTDRAVKRRSVELFLADPLRIGEPYLGRYAVWTSSGTSGEPGIFVHDGQALAVHDALEMQRFRGLSSPAAMAARMMAGERYAMVAATGGHFAGVATIARLQRQCPWMTAGLRVFSILQPLDALVSALNAYRPTLVAAYPTAASVLADEQESGRLKIDLSELWLGGETLSASTRERLAQVFGCRIRSGYGSSEFMSIACECERGTLHANTDWALLEPVDARYRAVPPDVASHTVLLTNLANYVQPILRYDLGDSVTLLSEPCACGSALPAIRVEGRQDDILALQDAAGHVIKLLPLALATIIEDEAHVHRFQLVAHHPQELLVRLDGDEDARGAWPTLSAVLKRYLSVSGLSNVRVKLDALAPQYEPLSGKLRRIVTATTAP